MIENKLIRQLVEKIVRGYDPKRIILFGSYAYGTPTSESDIDLFIIKNTDKRPMDRWMEVKRLLRDPDRVIPVSPLVYTEREIEERQAIKDLFLAEIFEKGKVLYG
ncbi:MAG: nucleotidyltransferase domain-containing protein [Candidatus Latescibacterota bacterium]